MRVKIKSHTPITPYPWWYAGRIGEEFEVEKDPKQDSYYINRPIKGVNWQRSILKSDCEILN